MRTKTSFRPTVDRVELRILATAGLVHPPTHHPTALVHHAPIKTVVIESSHSNHHAAPKHQSAPVHAPVALPSPPSSTPPPSDTTPGAQAWVELINMTNTPLNYRLSLAPYDGGTYHTFTIDSGYPLARQYQYVQLTQTGPNSVSDFKIQFGSQAPVSLTSTGPSEFAARAYSIFVDGNGQYYVQAQIG